MEPSLELLYCSLRTDVLTTRLGEYLDEFAGLINRAPLNATLRVQRVEDSCVTCIRELNAPECIQDVGTHVLEVLSPQYGFGRTVLLCDPSHVFARCARKAAPHAEWGVACGCLAIVYGSTDKYVIWHETLHLFGAEDCYNPGNPNGHPNPNCGQPNCIMQYAPTVANVGNWPFLCGENVSRVRQIGVTSTFLESP